MVNRPIVTHLRTPSEFARPATGHRVLLLETIIVFLRLCAGCLRLWILPGGGKEATGEISRFTNVHGAETTETRPTFCALRRCPARCVLPPFGLGGGSGGGGWGARGGEWGAVAGGNEDTHAAFFLTIADEKNKPEFCKSDPRRRRGWGWVEAARQSTLCRPCTTELLPRFWQIHLSPSRSPASPVSSGANRQRQAGAPLFATLFTASPPASSAHACVATPSPVLAPEGRGGEGRER